MDVAKSLCAIVASGRAKRGVARLCKGEILTRAVNILERAGRVVLVTGFYVPIAKSPETDGPPGTAVLARALQGLGKTVETATDRPNIEAFAACCSVLGIEAPLCVFSPEEILARDPDALVFVERLGAAADGRYYNMRGEDITFWTACLDRAASLVEGEIPVVAIGDGGNEAGMGCLKEELENLLPSFSKCLCQVTADVALPVDVSNWGAYALSGLLSVKAGRWLGHDLREERAMIEAMVERGAVDGVSCLRTASVDGMPAEVHEAVVNRIRNLCMEHIQKKGAESARA
ncbi:MAG: DUF4392 domain-containing protein [Thermovirgaceae bacterium]